MNEEYLKQNDLGFEGDSFIAEELQKLIAKHDINVIIETGTYRGCTTKRLTAMARMVHTIENNPVHFAISGETLLGIENVNLIKGNSAEVLPKLLELIGDEKVLFFLDAHWESFNPLLEELKAIADKNLKPVIFIHDFKVPGRPDLGYDSYAGQDYDFEWIKDSIEKIYGAGGYVYHYNNEAIGAKRGVIYIEPTTGNDGGS